VKDLSTKALLRSGELAKLAGISVDTLHHYERMRVLPEPRRSQSNYRLYPASAIERVQLVRRALAAGFSLPELARILKVREQGGAPCKQVQALLQKKLADLDQEILDLTSLRGSIRALLEDWQQRLSATAPGEPARLLENLPAISQTKGNPNEKPTRKRVLRNGTRRPRSA